MSETTTTEAPEGPPPPDGPLLDLTDAGVKKFIKQAKTRGYVTMDELNKVLPSRGGHLRGDRGHAGHALRDGRQRRRGRGRRAEQPRAARSRCAKRPPSSRPTKESAYDRTDDPVRMYLREMGSVELLSREGEIAIAKRIEAGRDTMIRGLCESALTFEAIMVWREELGLGRILLREVIDLEQTYGGQVAQALSDDAVAGEQIEAEPAAARRATKRTATKAARRRRDDDDDFDDGAGPTISAMEAELREGVMATLDAIAGEFEAFRAPAGAAGRAPPEAART